MNPFRIGKSEFSLEELLEFNDLLVSVVKGQAPMEETLQITSKGSRGRLRRVTNSLIESLQKGHSLADALDEQPAVFHRTYRETVRAGEEGGFLGAVLESFSSYIWQLLALRRKLGQAILYPMLVLVVAYLLLVFTGGRMINGFIVFYESGDLAVPASLETLNSIFTKYTLWIWIFPLLLGAAWISWMRSNDSRMLSLSGGAALLRLIPGLSSVLRLHRLANFTELMASMMEQQVPFGHAVQVAARASGDQLLIEGSQSSDTLSHNQGKVPPFLEWLMELGSSDSKVGRPMHYAAQMYRRRAETATEWIKILAPFAFLIIIGGGATRFYALMVFRPLVTLLQDLF